MYLSLSFSKNRIEMKRKSYRNIGRNKLEDCKIFGVESASTKEGRVLGTLSRETTRLTERARIYSALSERGEREGKGEWERLTSTRDNCRDTRNGEPLESIFRMRERGRESEEGDGRYLEEGGLLWEEEKVVVGEIERSLRRWSEWWQYVDFKISLREKFLMWKRRDRQGGGSLDSSIHTSVFCKIQEVLGGRGNEKRGRRFFSRVVCMRARLGKRERESRKREEKFFCPSVFLNPTLITRRAILSFPLNVVLVVVAVLKTGSVNRRDIISPP